MDFTHLTLSDVILLLGCIAIVVIALRTLWVGIRSFTNVLFALSLFFLSGYVFSNYMIDVVNNEGMALFWSRLSAVSILMFVSSIFVFSRVFDTKYTTKKKIQTLLITFVSGIILSCFSFTNIVIAGVNIDVYPVSLIRGPLYYLLIVVLILMSLLTAISLYRSYKSAYKIEKYQIKYILAGLLSAAAILFFTNGILPYLGINDYARIGPSFIVILALMGGYALTNSNLSDLNFVLLRSSFFTAIIMLYLTFFTYIYQSLERIYGSIYSSNSVIILLFSGFLSLFILNKIKDIEDRVLEKFDRSRRLDIFDKINQIFVKYSSLDEIKSLLKKNLELGFQSKSVMIYIQSESHDIDIVNKEIISFDQLLLQKLRGLKLSAENEKIMKMLEVSNLALIVPLKLEDELLGYITFEDKTVSTPYTLNELKFLENLTSTIAVGLKKVLLYAEVQGFNQTLQTKIDEATAELQHQKAQLEEKYQFEKDMMGIMGHELRTPMTVAKGMAELVLEKTKKPDATIDRAYLAEKMDRIFKSIVKESDLIQTMLSTSHIDNNKVNLQLSKIDIKEIIDFNINAFKKDAEAKNLEIIVEMGLEDIPEIINDQNRVQEIINNLISNAIKYTNEGFVRIHMERQGDFVLFSVQDSGLGIPKEELKNIGKKFYRIHQHLDEKKDVVRAGGTGLGLYVVKGLLKAMGGELIVESEEGKGSKFTALFPLEVKDNENVIISEVGSDSNDMFEKMGLERH